MKADLWPPYAWTHMCTITCTSYVRTHVRMWESGRAKWRVLLILNNLSIYLLTYCMHGSGQPAGFGSLLPLCGSQGLNQAISLAVSALILSHFDHPLLGIFCSCQWDSLTWSVQSVRCLKLNPEIWGWTLQFLFFPVSAAWPVALKIFTPCEFSKTSGFYILDASHFRRPFPA